MFNTIFDIVYQIYFVVVLCLCLYGVIRLRIKFSSYIHMDIVNEYMFSYGNGVGYDAIWVLVYKLLKADNSTDRMALCKTLREYHNETQLRRISHGYGRYVNIGKDTNWLLRIDLGRAEVDIQLNPRQNDVIISNPELLMDMYRVNEDQFMACMAIAKYVHAIKHRMPTWIERKTMVDHIAKNYHNEIYSYFKPLNFNRDYYGMPWLTVINNSDPDLPVEEGTLFSIEVWMGGDAYKLYSDFYRDVWFVNNQRVSFKKYRKSLMRSIKKWQETNRMHAQQRT